jgi:hypothetical protein
MATLIDVVAHAGDEDSWWPRHRCTDDAKQTSC